MYLVLTVLPPGLNTWVVPSRRSINPQINSHIFSAALYLWTLWEHTKWELFSVTVPDLAFLAGLMFPLLVAVRAACFLSAGLLIFFFFFFPQRHVQLSQLHPSSCYPCTPLSHLVYLGSESTCDASCHFPAYRNLIALLLSLNEGWLSGLLPCASSACDWSKTCLMSCASHGLTASGIYENSSGRRHDFSYGCMTGCRILSIHTRLLSCTRDLYIVYYHHTKNV